jgi:hypothetical protein
MATWIDLINREELDTITFFEVEHPNYKCKSVEVTIQFKALKDIEANTHAIKLEIDRNTLVSFPNGKRRKYIPIMQDVNREQLLKPIRIRLVSKTGLDLLKLSPRIFFEYFFRIQKYVKYTYEGDFHSKPID